MEQIEYRSLGPLLTRSVRELAEAESARVAESSQCHVTGCLSLA